MKKLALLGAIALAMIPATVTAHTGRVEFTCTKGAVVTLKDYRPGPNHIVVTLDGQSLVDTYFGTSFHDAWFQFDRTVGHDLTVDVFAWDDDPNEDNRREWSFYVEKHLGPCEQPTPTPTPTPTATPTISVPPATEPPTSRPHPTPNPTPPPTDTPEGQPERPLSGVPFLLAIAGVLGLAAVYLRRSQS